MDTAERIFTRMKEIGLEQKLFATQVGVSPQKVSEWKLGKAKSYTKYLPQIAEVLGVSAQYLLTGEGPKKRTASTNVPDSGTPDFMVKFRQLSPNAQKEVLAFIEFKRGQEDNNAGI